MSSNTKIMKQNEYKHIFNKFGKPEPESEPELRLFKNESGSVRT